MAIFHDMAWTYRAALASDEPIAALKHAVAEGLAEYDGDRQRVLNDLEQLRLVARRDGQDETPILDVMDFMTGWCGPRERI